MTTPFSNMGKGSTVEAICFMAGGEIAEDRRAVKIRNLIISHKYGMVMTGTRPARLFEMRRGGAMPLNTKVAYVFSKDTQHNKISQYDMDTEVMSTIWDAAYQGSGLTGSSVLSYMQPKYILLAVSLIFLMMAVVFSFSSSDTVLPPVEDEMIVDEQIIEDPSQTEDQIVETETEAPLPEATTEELEEPADAPVGDGTGSLDMQATVEPPQ